MYSYIITHKFIYCTQCDSFDDISSSSLFYLEL